IIKRTISHNFADKLIAFKVLRSSQNDPLGNLLRHIFSGRQQPPAPITTSKEAFDASFTVLQRSTSSVAGEAVSKLAARFSAGTAELARLVRRDQDLTTESGRLDKALIGALSKPAAVRNPVMEDQIRKRIDEIKSERAKVQEVFNERYPDYAALSG